MIIIKSQEDVTRNDEITAGSCFIAMVRLPTVQLYCDSEFLERTNRDNMLSLPLTVVNHYSQEKYDIKNNKKVGLRRREGKERQRAKNN